MNQLSDLFFLTENDVFLKMNNQMMAASPSKVLVLAPFLRRIMSTELVRT